MTTIKNPVARWSRWMLTPELDDYRYIVYYGGRSGGKSWQIARVLAMLAARQPLRILCLREIQKSIGDSSKLMIEDSIKSLGLSQCFDMQRYATRCVNGSEFVYRGLGGVTTDTIRSFESADICWIEEGSQISDDSWKVLIPTIRKPGSKIILSFNPVSRADVVYSTFVANNPPARSFVKRINYTDNPFTSEETLEQVEYDREYNPEMFRHIWLGECAPDMGTLRVLRIDDLDKCVNAYPNYRHMIDDYHPEVGLDVADMGEDMNAMTTRFGPLVTNYRQWHGGESVSDTARIADAHCNQIGASDLAYDASGVGTGVRSALKEMGRRGYFINDERFGGKVKGEDLVFRNNAKNKDMFMRRNSQMAWNIRLRVENTIKLLDGGDVNPDLCLFINPEVATPAYIDVLNQPTWDDTTGKIRIRKAAQGERSPDAFDSLVLAFARDSQYGLSG